MKAQEALSFLKEGNSRYTNDNLTHPNSDNNRKKSQTGGQTPFAIILSCADSRVVPELIFDQGIGDLFVIRVAGNTANASSIASIEYAVAHLGTKLIVVLGHESCGA
ncbi:MAG: carbonic anhydrase, partial [Flavobacteriales bacterium]